MPGAAYRLSVFINVPFDQTYKTIFDAVVFAVFDCGLIARSALETDDASQVRIDKIYELIAASKYGIHDISLTSLDKKHRLPRFNMPFEFGIFLGAKKFGQQKHRRKRALVFERKPYLYQKYCSDIAGQDIRAHNGSVRSAIRHVRNWAMGDPQARGKTLPGANYMVKRYRRFRRELPFLCRKLNLDKSDLHFNDYTALVVGWLKAN